MERYFSRSPPPLFLRLYIYIYIFFFFIKPIFGMFNLAIKVDCIVLAIFKSFY